MYCVTFHNTHLLYMFSIGLLNINLQSNWSVTIDAK